MNEALQELRDHIAAAMEAEVLESDIGLGELMLRIERGAIVKVAKFLRDRVFLFHSLRVQDVVHDKFRGTGVEGVSKPWSGDHSIQLMTGYTLGAENLFALAGLIHIKISKFNSFGYGTHTMFPLKIAEPVRIITASDQEKKCKTRKEENSQKLGHNKLFVM
jgi:hypothetical protein